MIARPAWLVRATRRLLGAPGPTRRPPIAFEGVRTVPLVVLRVAAALLVAGSFALLGPAVVGWFLVGPLLVAAVAPSGTWAVAAGVTIVGVAVASGADGPVPMVLAVTLPLAVHLSLLADAGARSDLRTVGVDVRLLAGALRSALLVACVVVPTMFVVRVVGSDLPGWLGILGLLGVVGLAVVSRRLTSSSRAR